MYVLRRSTGVAVRLAPPAALLAAYALWIRPRLLTWGAKPEEISRTHPTDELIPDPDNSVFTMATTLPAPPEKVWPWLAQVGVDRAGWYSWDRLDHWGVPSLDRIVPEWQSLGELSSALGRRRPNAAPGADARPQPPERTSPTPGHSRGRPLALQYAGPPIPQPACESQRAHLESRKSAPDPPRYASADGRVRHWS